MLNRWRTLRSFAIIALALGACQTSDHEALSPEPWREAETYPAAEQRERLQAIAKDHSDAVEPLQDLLLVVDAEDLQARGDTPAARDAWLKVLKSDKGTLAKTALDRWVQLSVKLKPNITAEALATELLSLNKGESVWLRRQALDAQAPLSKRMAGLLPPVPVAPGMTPEPSPLPTPESLDDPVFWDKRAKALCRKEPDAVWTKWIKSLNEGARFYWDALLADCAGESHEAIAPLRAAIVAEARWPEDRARLVRAADLLVSHLKAVGNREATTNAYDMQSQILSRPDLPLDLLGWTPFAAKKRTVESLQWVARNRALEGDYARATEAVDKALVANGELGSLASEGREQSQSQELFADSYNILASRILFEKKAYQEALDTNSKALALTGLNAEWQQRLRWAEGWYTYMLGEKGRAVQSWELFLNAARGDSERTKALFWMGRALWELGKKDEAEARFAQLQKIAPLSFYTVVGIQTVDKDFEWNKDFKGAEHKDLSDLDDFDWGVYKESPETIRRIYRLELALAAGMKDYIPALAQELFLQMNANKQLFEAIEPSLYATRLFYRANQHVLAISITTLLSDRHEDLWRKYPEQLFVFFAQPYPTSIKTYAEKNGVDPALVWGLARQESSFRAEVESPVGAIGLMQLMPATAQGLAKKEGVEMSLTQLRQELKQPDRNAQLGTRYLAGLGTRYKGQWPQAIGAYNAGEYAVDAWIARRQTPDLLTWIESVSYGETSGYIKNVWRNWTVYRWLNHPMD